MTVEPPVDRPVDWSLETDSRSSLPVDRGHFQRADALGGRPTRSTGFPANWLVHICAHRSTGPVDRCARERAHGQPSQPVDRTIDRLKAPHSRVGVGRPDGRPMALAQSTERSTRGTTVIKKTVGRSTGRAILPFPDCQRADF